jgi:predicted metalloprotease
VLVGLLVVSACGGGGGKKNSAKASDSTTDSNASDSGTDGTSTEVSSDFTDGDVKVGKKKFGPNDDDKIIRVAIDDVTKFWVDEFPKLYPGETYTPITGGEFPYGPSDPPPECGGTGKANYQDVAQNAFYCPPGDFVAWDTDNLTGNLLDEFGPFTLAIVVAHEMGHKVQGDHGILNGQFITFVTEQQADCFAGAWTKHALDGGSDKFKVELGDLDNALGGFLQIRDPVGTNSIQDESAHGSAFQRINAFEDGLKEGAERCKAYEDGTINFVPEVFDPGSLDEAENGNLPFPQVEPLVIANLEGFWTRAFQDIQKEWTTAKTNAFDPETGVSCGDKSEKGDGAVGIAFFCQADDTLNWDDVNLMPAVHDQIGDLAQSILIANLYSERAQELAGLETGTLDASLQADCFTGVWVGTTATDEINKILPAEAQLSLSPGDLDEAVSAFIQFGDKASDVQSGQSTGGTAFQHLDAFRAGFFKSFNSGFNSGLTDCVGGGGADAASTDSSS